MRRSWHASLLVTVVAITAVGCRGDSSSNGSVDVTRRDNGTGTETTDSTGSTTGNSTGDESDPFEWAEFGPNGNVQTGSLQVPIDYDDPSKGTFDLFVARHLADPDQRIGSLLVNPGGPGFGGSDYAIYADQVYGSDLLERFDIIGWDPRGTGLSEPAIDCTEDYDRYYASLDITPDDAAERQEVVDIAREFATNCVSQNDGYYQYVGTNNSARDMNAIREALGEETISYFGFSYGSELGATWATLFPETVRAAVLDGAADPTADFVESGLQQSEGFEMTLTTFLDQCAANSSCAFHNEGNTAQAFDDLMRSLDEQPVPSTDGRPPVNLQVALSGVAQAMYSDSLWPDLSEALAAAQDGDGEGLLALYDQYFDRGPDGTYSNALEAFQTIVCMDDAERLSVEEDDALVPEYQAAAPRLAAGTTGSYFCTFFPESIDPRVEVTGAGAGPILVMGTTGDSATPLASTRVMADTLEDGRLVVVTADQHTGYSVNDCSASVIEQYLIDPVANAPADGTEC